MGLSKNALIQANATIIAGVLILISIQYYTSPTLGDVNQQVMIHDKEMEILSKTEFNLTNSTVSPEFLDEFKQSKFVEGVALHAKLDAYKELQAEQKLRNDPFYLGVLTFPFLISIIFELGNWKDSDSDSPSRLGIFSMIVGFGMLFGFFSSFLLG